MTTWVVLRAAGIGAYLMLFLAVSWGLVGPTGVFGKRVSKVTSTTIHQYLGVAVLPLLAVHLGLLLIDKFRPFHVTDLVVPLHSTFRPLAVAFGVVAMYAMLVVLTTSWLKKRIGVVWWRATHLIATPALILAMVHGIFAGTDASRPWLWWTYVGTGTVVLFLLFVRAFTYGERPERKAPPVDARRRPAETVVDPSRGARVADEVVAVGDG